jgi:uncharacterized surface protein with fasciclin (FAS1) repeats
MRRRVVPSCAVSRGGGGGCPRDRAAAHLAASTSHPLTRSTFRGQELRRNPATSQLGDLLRSSGVDVAQLRNAGGKLKWTVFAPNNTAIARLQKSNRISRPQLEKALMTNAGRQFLLTHLYNKTALNSTQLRDGEVLTMSSGVNVTIRKFANNSVELVAPGSRAFVVTPNIKVGRSIVHIIDNALLPVDLAKYKAANEAKGKAKGKASAPSATGG